MFYVLVINTARSKESGVEPVHELIQRWSLWKSTPHSYVMMKNKEVMTIERFLGFTGSFFKILNHF